MNILVLLNGTDITDSCRLSDTRINYDSTRRITTASITVMAQAFSNVARYDYAHYDQDRYSLALRELAEIIILDGRDGVTKLFDGQIFALSLEQSDAGEFEVFLRCELNDWAALLDRAVCWDKTFALPFPASDQQIITALLTQFCPGITLGSIAAIVPVIQGFDWVSKTCRQVLDDVAGLSQGDWLVDFDRVLTYGPAAGGPVAPFALSTSPDYVTTFPVRVSNYRHDFSNPVNKAYVRGGVDPAGTYIEASYTDPISVGQYGEYAAAVVDEQISTAWDAALRAKATVLRYAMPIESGNFTIRKDGLKCGMKVTITEDVLGIQGDYTIRALSLAWEDQDTVRYEAQFGAAQPDLETLLRLLDQRTRWKTSRATAGIPTAGSITDAMIAFPGLSSGSIQSVNAGVIVGTITASQIETVDATTIQGVITAGQIGSVNATTIQGVVVSSQLANGIVDTLSKYVDALRPVPMLSAFPTLPHFNHPPNSFFYYIPDGHFYQINSTGTGWAVNDSPSSAMINFYHVGAVSANSIIGLIVAAQIGSITAGQITGQIVAGQIASVNASSISGSISAAQIGTVNASAIQGAVVSTQIGSVNAATITIGLIGSGQIGSVHGGTILAGTVTSNQLNAYSIDVGYTGSGGGAVPGRIRCFDNASNMVGEMGYLDATGNYGGWFKLFGAGGTSYANAVIKSDTAGDLSITDASFTVTGAGCTFTTSPTTFDTGGMSGYTSLALTLSDSVSKTAMITRGMVIYETGTKIGSFNRAPGGAWAELVVGVGGATIIVSGFDGSVRADGGFTSGGNVGVSEYFNVGGVNLRFVKGIYCGH